MRIKKAKYCLINEINKFPKISDNPGKVII